ncbi:MAG: histidine kinase dimerization/phosphoacceptor domain -containing protein [Janthinobacterium lividum]
MDIAACASEPIHIPGAIQPHGLLLVADPVSLEVVAGAGRLEGRLDPDWLGRSLADLLGQAMGSVTLELAAGNAVVVLEPVEGIGETFDATAQRSGEWLVVELEPAPEQTHSSRRLLSLTAVSSAFDRTVDLRALCQAAATAFRKLTGFDRIMVYRFLDDDAGTVVAEDQVPELGSFLNHHFPASDIPAQARALYVRNQVRVIPDVDYVPAPVRPGVGWGGLDMSDIGLRSVSPVHVQYLRNMAVKASASISIVKDGSLWGLIACHHREPRQLSYETRLACSALAADLSRQIRAKDDAEMYRQRIRLRSHEDAIVGHLGNMSSLDAFLANSGDELCRMLRADGFAAVQKTDLYLAGRCPDEENVRAVARWAAKRAVASPFFSNNLATEYPEAKAYQDLASGLLAVTMSTDVPTILMWFRAEQLETVKWAGNPHKAVVAGSIMPLTPRASFDAWSELVEGRSEAWSLSEVEAANRLQRKMFEVQQAHRLRALNHELIATIADKESLLEQKDYLVKEVNHRVQNSLQLVSSFLRIQSNAIGNDVVTVQLDEAQRRLSAVALVHRRLYSGDQAQTVDLARYLDDLCTDMKAAMGTEWSALISTDFSPVLVTTERAVNIGLILTELVINANKYAYAGQPGPLAIILDQQRSNLRLVVSDEGIGKVTARVGFGTRMLNAMVKTLAGTIEEANNAPGLRTTLTAPVQRPAAAK